MTLSLVTIGIPTYSRLLLLEEAVASALAQTYPNVEVLISDDGPPGPISVWATALAAREPRVRYRRNVERRGLAGNWNAVADDARGERLVIIGDDDRLLPEFVERLVSDPNVDVAFCNHHVIDESGARLPEVTLEWTRRYGREALEAGVVSGGSIVWRNGVPMSGALIRTSIIRRLRFKEDLNTPELELFARLVAEGGSFWFEPGYLAEYRIHRGSETTRGLTFERLVRHLEPVPAPRGLELLKEQMLGSILVGAADLMLRSGARAEAARLIRAPHYPSRVGARVLAQRLCAPVPALGPLAYRAATWLRAR